MRGEKPLARTCERRFCARCLWLQFTGSLAGRVLLIVWLSLALVGLVTILTACGPEKKNPNPAVSCEAVDSTGFTVCREVR